MKSRLARQFVRRRGRDPNVALAGGQYRRIARKAGLSPQHVSRVLQGRKGASLHVAYRIAIAADVTLDGLYGYILDQPTYHVQGRRTRGQLQLL